MTADQYLSGGQLTALTMLHWTNAPYQGHSGDGPEWLRNAFDGLRQMGLATTINSDQPHLLRLTDKGRAMVDAMLAVPEPTQVWVLQPK